MISVFYTEGLRQREGRYYESFIAMSILFMALNYMNYKYLDVDIDRDFYDLDSLKLIYEAYGVPFYEDIPLTYHKRIVKNINRLIKYKGSNKVFVELCDLFDYDILGIYQYYLLKRESLIPMEIRLPSTNRKRMLLVISNMRLTSNSKPCMT